MINSLKVFALSLVLGIVAISCSENQSTDVTTRNGYRLEFLKNEEGEGPEKDHVFLYEMKVFVKDSLLHSTWTDDDPLDFRWLDQEQIEKTNNPVLDAFEMMSAGDSARVYMPADSLPPNQKFGLVSGEFLVYDLSVLDLISPATYDSLKQVYMKRDQEKNAELALVAEAIGTEVQQTLSAYKSGALENVQKHDSGLEYVIHEEGTGPKPNARERVSVHYYGVLKESGELFDNSYGRGNPIQFPLGAGQVIKGWDVGISLLNKGSKATLFIPFDMAYGAAGSPSGIPEKADLVFFVHLQE